MNHTETTRERREADRRAAVAARSAGSYAGVQNAAPIAAGTNSSGAWVPYGRVGVTAISDGFRVRSTHIYGRVGITPITDGFRVKGS